MDGTGGRPGVNVPCELDAPIGLPTSELPARPPRHGPRGLRAARGVDLDGAGEHGLRDHVDGPRVGSHPLGHGAVGDVRQVVGEAQLEIVRSDGGDGGEAPVGGARGLGTCRDRTVAGPVAPSAWMATPPSAARVVESSTVPSMYRSGSIPLRTEAEPLEKLPGGLSGSPRLGAPHGRPGGRGERVVRSEVPVDQRAGPVRKEEWTRRGDRPRRPVALHRYLAPRRSERFGVHWWAPRIPTTDPRGPPEGC